MEAGIRKPFTKIVAFLLLIIAGAQAMRASAGIDVVVDGYAVPIMASWIAAGVALLLSVMLFMESRS